MSVASANYAIRSCVLQDVAAKMVLTVLAWQSDKATPHLAHMSNEQLRVESGLKSVNGIKEAIRRLVAAGEIKVLRVGGRNLATEYELTGYLRHVSAVEVSPSDISDYDSKVSPNDTNRQITTVKCRHLTPKDKDNNKTEDISASAPAPATSSPSQPSSPPKPARVKFDPCSLPLPHRSSRFASTWADWVEHRRQIRKPLTEVAAKRLLAQLARFTETAAIDKMDRAMAAGWQGCIFPQDLEELRKVVPMVSNGRTAADDYYDALEKRVGGIKA